MCHEQLHDPGLINLSQAGADPEIIFFSKGPEVQIKLIMSLLTLKFLDFTYKNKIILKIKIEYS